MDRASPIKQIVLVGHCRPDMYMLQGSLRTMIGEVPFAQARDSAALQATVTPDSLLLINRVLEPGFSTSSGIDLIRQLAGRTPPPRMMLVSNYDDAQERAVQAGAFPGFGKAQLGSPLTRSRLQAALDNS